MAERVPLTSPGAHWVKAIETLVRAHQEEMSEVWSSYYFMDRDLDVAIQVIEHLANRLNDCCENPGVYNDFREEWEGAIRSLKLRRGLDLPNPHFPSERDEDRS